MSVPAPYREIQPPWLVDGSGAPMSNAQELTDPNWPVFLRAALIGRTNEWKHWGVDMSRKLRAFPGWFLYGGPIKRQHAKSLEQYLAHWAFHAGRPELGEEGFFVVAETRPIAPPYGPASPWPPNPQLVWHWALETAMPLRQRLVFAYPNAHWKVAGGGEVAGLPSASSQVEAEKNQYIFTLGLVALGGVLLWDAVK